MKVGIVGLGWVGTSVAASTLHGGFIRELLLSDLRPGLAEGEAMDLAHGAPFYGPTQVRAVELEAMLETDAVVISAGKGGTEKQSRLELLRENARIARNLGQALRGYEGLVVVVTNPVDVMTQLIVESSGLPPERVLGTGTMLDTARFRERLGRRLGVEARSVHAQVVGEHGDSSVCLWSSAQVGGVALRDYPGWDVSEEASIAQDVRRAAYEIIKRKGATNHAIGLVTAALLRWALIGADRVLTVSMVQNGAFGLKDVALSLPTVVGRSGARQVLEPALSHEEREGLERSASVLRSALADVSA